MSRFSWRHKTILVAARPETWQFWSRRELHFSLLMQAVGQGYLHLWWYFPDFKRPKHFPILCKYLCIINGHQNCIVLHTKPIKRGNGYSQLDITIYSKELWKISAWNISFHNLMFRAETVHRYWPLCLWLHKRWMKKSVKFSYSWNSSRLVWVAGHSVLLENGLGDPR